MSNECPKSPANSDEELVACYQTQGCVNSLNLLVERHLGPVRQLMYSLILDDILADDLTQDVFLRAIRGLGKFQGKSAFATWLYRIAMNAAYSHFERNQQPRERFQALDADPVAAEPRPEQAAAAHELEQEIERALAELSPTLRAAIVLTCLQGLAPETAAEIENCPVSTMYWRIHEARKQLQSQLQRYFA